MLSEAFNRTHDPIPLDEIEKRVRYIDAQSFQAPSPSHAAAYYRSRGSYPKAL